MIDDLSVTVPAYNEEANISGTVAYAYEVFKSKVAERTQWILVDDGSTDGTWREIQDLAQHLPDVVPVKHPENRGLGSAIWTGMSHASLQWCTWLPADGQFAPEVFAEMSRLAGESDLVVLMRNERERSWERRLMTAVFYGWMRLMLGFNPYGFSGIYMAPRQQVQGVPLVSSTGMQNYAVALYCQERGARVSQVWANVRPRISGKSKVANVRTICRILWDAVRVRATGRSYRAAR